MIGLLFLLAIVLWAMTAYCLGTRLPRWAKLKHRVLWTWVLVPVLFFLPVVDEIIAWPQLKMLCKSVDSVKYDPQTAIGKTVSKYSSVIGRDVKTLFPGIQVRIEHRALVTPVAEVPIVKWASVEPQAGFLKFPAGSSGSSMSLLLTDCGFTARDSERFLKIVETLKLVKTDYQPTK